MKLAGIILIVIGVIALVYQGFSYNQTKKDAQIGSLVIQHEETEHVWVPPVIGAVCVVAGVAALALGARGKS
jgi:drug/metabolite transporter (DMT)-like permease